MFDSESLDTEQVAILHRYPRLAAHMIAESLGYFSPGSAASAIRACRNQEPYFCELYVHLASRLDAPYAEAVAQVTQSYPGYAFEGRRCHVGFMADYRQALALVQDAIRTGKGPVFASWF